MLAISFRLFVVSLAVFSLGGTVSALAREPGARPGGSASRAGEAPLIDGNVADDPAWAGAEVLTGFFQTTPDAGAPATQRTEVRVVFTDEAIYFGVMCLDAEPDGIIVSESRRDASLDESDSFQIILDTFRDERNGFVFGTNPAGIEYDGQVTNEGRAGGGGGRRQQSGAGAGFNLNWDGDWDVRAQIGDYGWSAEFRLPFKTLRFSKGEEQVWGLNFQRNIRRRNETAYWAPLERQFDLYRLSAAGTLSGVDPPSQRNLKVAPYVLGQTLRDFAVAVPETETNGEFGVDLKYSVTPSLTLDATYNTDFAQVEVDDLQINLDRFNLFFPEKRPFFLENAGQFTMGNPGSVEMFFSRRIGLGPDGEIIPILLGARLSGKAGNTNLGFLNMQTRSVEGVTPANNFTVARVGHDLPNRSGVGGIFVNRTATGELADTGDYNRAYGIDGRWGIGEYLNLSGYVAGTSTPDISKGAYSYRAAAVYSSPSWRLSADYTEVGEGFNPEVGFLRRENYRNPAGLIFYTHRFTDFLGLLEARPHVSYRGFWKPEGFQETGFFHLDTHWEWRNGYELHTGVNFTREGVLEEFEIFPDVYVQPATYDNTEVQIRGFTNQGAPLSYNTRVTVGGFFSGSRFSLDQTLRARIGETFNTEVSWVRNDVDLEEGAFVTNLARARVSYSFTTKILLQALLQYNDRDDIWSTNVRFSWLHRGNTGLFIVYNEVRDVDDAIVRGVRDRSLTIKFSGLFDVLK